MEVLPFTTVFYYPICGSVDCVSGPESETSSPKLKMLISRQLQKVSNDTCGEVKGRFLNRCHAHFLHLGAGEEQ